MTKLAKPFGQLLYVLAWGAAIWMAFNMILMPLNWQEVFIDKQTTTGVEIFLLFGFGLILLFDLLVTFFAMVDKFRKRSLPASNNYLLAGGIFCLFMLLTSKVLADEVGRESRFGLGVVGEYIILNIPLLIQMAFIFYAIFVLRKTALRMP